MMGFLYKNVINKQIVYLNTGWKLKLSRNWAFEIMCIPNRSVIFTISKNYTHKKVSDFFNTKLKFHTKFYSDTMAFKLKTAQTL